MEFFPHEAFFTTFFSPSISKHLVCSKKDTSWKVERKFLFVEGIEHQSEHGLQWVELVVEFPVRVEGPWDCGPFCLAPS